MARFTRATYLWARAACRKAGWAAARSPAWGGHSGVPDRARHLACGEIKVRVWNDGERGMVVEYRPKPVIVVGRPA